MGATTLPLLFPSVVLRYYRSSHQTVLVLVGHQARYYLIDPGVSETVVSETGGNRARAKVLLDLLSHLAVAAMAVVAAVDTLH